MRCMPGPSWAYTSMRSTFSTTPVRMMSCESKSRHNNPANTSPWHLSNSSPICGTNLLVVQSSSAFFSESHCLSGLSFTRLPMQACLAKCSQLSLMERILWAHVMMFLNFEAKPDVACMPCTFSPIFRVLAESRMTSLPEVSFSSVALSRLTKRQKPLTKPLRKAWARGMRKNVVGLQPHYPSGDRCGIDWIFCMELQSLERTAVRTHT
jgi:hypothetical protein